VEHNTVNSVDKALEVLEVFLKHGPSIGVSELSALSGLNVGTTHRIASTLVRKGYLRQTNKRGKYSLGLKFLDFGEVFRSTFSIREVAYPFLEKLHRLIGEAVILAVLDGNEVVRADLLRSSHLLGVTFNGPTKVHAPSTGVGKMLLANMPEQELERYLSSHPLDSYTPYTITDPTELKKQLKVINREGIAFDEEEREIGLRSIAGPIRDCDGSTVASIGILVPTVRITRQRLEELVPTIKRYALEISRALGYKGE